MKVLNSWLLGCVVAVFTIGCQGAGSESTDEVEKEETEVELSQEEMNAKTEKLISRLVEPADFNLKLDNSVKWKIDPEGLKKLLQVKQQIYVISGNMQNYEVPSYNMLGDEVLEFVNKIPELTDAEANVEFQKVIKETKTQCVFLMGSNLQEAQVAVINLSILYDEVPKYFENAEK